MDNEKNNEERKIIPKNAFDSEYFTEWLREVRFLTDKGIRYTFVRKTTDYNISQFKYKKTPALFAALVEFYAIVEAEKAVRRKARTETKISPEDIRRAQEILEQAIKQNVTEEKPEEEEKDDTV